MSVKLTEFPILGFRVEKEENLLQFSMQKFAFSSISMHDFYYYRKLL